MKKALHDARLLDRSVRQVSRGGRMVWLVALLALMLPAPAGAQEVPSAVLSGIGPVKVLVEVFGEHLRPADIRRAVEAQLRSAGVPVGNREQTVIGYLFVKVALHCDESGLCAYRVDVYLDEDVHLFRGRVEYVYAAYTWHSDGAVGYVGLDHVSEIMEDVKIEVDVFVRAYFMANPK